MQPRGIIVHCSDSIWGNPQLVDGWHKDRGFNRQVKFVTKEYPLQYVGYHFMITNQFPFSSSTPDTTYDGVIHLGRMENETGAHAYGYQDYLGVMLFGKGIYTSNQMVALYTKLSELLLKYNLPVTKVLGHNETRYELAKPINQRKTCPMLPMSNIRNRLSGSMGAQKTFFIGGKSND